MHPEITQHQPVDYAKEQQECAEALLAEGVQSQRHGNDRRGRCCQARQQGGARRRRDTAAIAESI